MTRTCVSATSGVSTLTYWRTWWTAPGPCATSRPARRMETSAPTESFLINDLEAGGQRGYLQDNLKVAARPAMVKLAERLTGAPNRYTFLYIEGRPESARTIIEFSPESIMAWRDHSPLAGLSSLLMVPAFVFLAAPHATPRQPLTAACG